MIWNATITLGSITCQRLGIIGPTGATGATGPDIDGLTSDGDGGLSVEGGVTLFTETETSFLINEVGIFVDTNISASVAMYYDPQRGYGLYSHSAGSCDARLEATDADTLDGAERSSLYLGGPNDSRFFIRHEGPATAGSDNVKIIIDRANANSLTIQFPTQVAITQNSTISVPANTSGTLTIDAGTFAPDTPGTRGEVQRSFSAATAIAASDCGKMLYHPASDANARTVTIPANGSTPFDVGFNFEIINDSANAVTLAITTDTLVQAGTGTTGSITIPQYGTCFVRKVTSTRWYATPVVS